MRTALRGLVLLFWVVMMAALARRLHPDFDLPEVASPVIAGGEEEWQGVYSEGRKIGYAWRRRAASADGFDLENHAVVRIVMMGEPRLVKTKVVAHTGPRLELRTFDFRMTAGTVEFTAVGGVRDSTLEVKLGGAVDRTIRLPLAGPIFLPQTLYDVLGREPLETGKKLRYSMFDPTGGEPGVVELTVGELTTVDTPEGERSAFEVIEEYRGSRFRLLVDRDGKVLREEGPLGLVLVRETAEEARAGGVPSGEALDVTTASAIPGGRAIDDPRQAKRLTLRVTGIPPGQSLSWPPRQTLEGEILRIEAEDVAAAPSFPLPSRDPLFEPDLQSTTFIQSDDPKIRETAASIVSGETDARRAARKLLDWVYENVRKVPTVSVPSAADVLAAREGDCNEHSVLYAALARAVGLPARVIAGTVYMPGDGVAAGAFYYHAWVDVWLGRWTAVDPTFGQFPADATHVKFMEGGPEAHTALLQWIGKIRVAVEDVG